MGKYLAAWRLMTSSRYGLTSSKLQANGRQVDVLLLRMATCNTSVFTNDVVRAPQYWNVLDDEAKDNRARQRAQ